MECVYRDKIYERKGEKKNKQRRVSPVKIIADFKNARNVAYQLLSTDFFVRGTKVPLIVSEGTLSLTEQISYLMFEDVVSLYIFSYKSWMMCDVWERRIWILKRSNGCCKCRWWTYMYDQDVCHNDDWIRPSVRITTIINFSSFLKNHGVLTSVIAHFDDGKQIVLHLGPCFAGVTLILYTTSEQRTTNEK